MSAAITTSIPTGPDGIPMPVTSIATALSNSTVGQDKELLSKLLVSYQNALDSGRTAADLKSVARQISDAAQVAGVAYRLPTVNAVSGTGTTSTGTVLNQGTPTGAATPPASGAPSDTSKLNVST